MAGPKMWSPRGKQLWVYFMSAETDEDTHDRPYGPYDLVQGTYEFLRVWRRRGEKVAMQDLFLARWDGKKKLWILDGEGAREADRGTEWSDFVVFTE